MLYKIIEVSTEKGSAETYVLVHFWLDKKAYEDGKPPHLINDFIMQLRPKGWEKPDEDSPAVEVNRDVVAELRANITAYLERSQAVGLRGDHSNAAAFSGAALYEGNTLLRPANKMAKKHFVRDASDPNDILKRDDVKELPGSTTETLSVHP